MSQLRQSQNSFFRASLDPDPLGFLLFCPRRPLSRASPLWALGSRSTGTQGLVVISRRLPKSACASSPPAQVPGEEQKRRSWLQGIEGGQPSSEWPTGEPGRWGWKQTESLCGEEPRNSAAPASANSLRKGVCLAGAAWGQKHPQPDHFHLSSD